MNQIILDDIVLKSNGAREASTIKDSSEIVEEFVILRMHPVYGRICLAITELVKS